jgi:hypothetical protein
MNRVRVLTVLLSAAVLVGGLLAPQATAGPVWLTSNASWTNPDATASSPLPRVITLHYGHHPRFDRVVIRIRGAFPGGRTRYQRDFTYDASGQPVPIRGQSGLQVTLTPAYGHDDSGNNLYVGPRLARPRLQTLTALAYTGDFEGHVSFAFALTYRAPYRVFTLEAPRRIVIDFRHQS